MGDRPGSRNSGGSVDCERLEHDPDDKTGTTIVNPSVVVDVLSPSTEEYDRGDKREHDQRVESLQEIMLVAHEERRIEVWRRRRRADPAHVGRRTPRAKLGDPLEEVPSDAPTRDVSR